MSHRSYIGVEMPDGKVKMVYCHSGGLPESNGKEFADNMSSLKEIEDVVDKGGMGGFYYGVDGIVAETYIGKEAMEVNHCDSLGDAINLLQEDIHVEYMYLFKAGNEDKPIMTIYGNLSYHDTDDDMVNEGSIIIDRDIGKLPTMRFKNLQSAINYSERDD